MIRFKARVVHCTEAIGGDILQVTFDSVDLEDEDCRQSPYVLLGQCFEFPGRPTIEWHDGTDYNGGAQIRSVVLKPNLAKIVTDTGPAFEIGLSLTVSRYQELATYLRNIFPKTTVLNTD